MNHPSCAAVGDKGGTVTITTLIGIHRAIYLSELPPDNTGNVQFGMGIAEEASWVCFDLLQHEGSASVNAIRQNSCRERTVHAALGTTVLLVTLRIREGKARRA